MRGKVLLAVAVLLLSAGSAAARWGMPDPLTDRGKVVEDIYTQIAIAGILVFLLVFVLLVFVLGRYREGSGKGRATHEKHRGSLAAEMTWTLIPLGVMLWIGYIAYAGLVTLDNGNQDVEPEMTIQVTGYQFAWEMNYGGVKVLVNPSIDAETGNVTFAKAFHVPAGVPIQFNITSGDVIHAFNVMDANRAYVSLDDANPDGPHKQHRQVHVLPEGEYSIQCREMCGPGHAYMRATMVAEPRADFDRWLKRETLAAGAALVQDVRVTADGDSLAMEGMTTEDGVEFLPIVAGTRVILEVENTADTPLDLSLSTSKDLGTIPAHSTDVVYFDTAAEVPGDRTIVGSNNATLTFRAIQAEVVEVDLGAYRLIPEHLDLKAGTTYLFKVKNVHSAAHNLFVGHLGPDEQLEGSDTIAGGSTASFTWEAVAGEYDMWCTVPTHAELGMVGTVTVS